MAETKIRNPFLHTHDHDHDHDHDHGDGHHHDHNHEPEDPAQQSLADALRVSFGLLKWIMAILIVVYLFTGIFSVTPQERAVRLRFGKLVGEPGQQVYGPGWHFGLPYPIEQYLKIPVDERTVMIDRAFWFQPPPGSEGQTIDQMRGGPLNPERDGSLLTGDANIVHGQFQLKYHVAEDGVADFVQHVGSLQRADEIVRNAAEQGIVAAAAQLDADTVIRDTTTLPPVAALRIQEVLDELRTGIQVNTLTMTSTMPLSVRDAYQAVINAESERAQAIEAARQRATSTLNETAGEAHDALLTMVEGYELARATGDVAEADRLLGEIDRALDAQQVATSTGGTMRIGGEAATIINRARTESTSDVQQVKADANRFQQLLAEYREAPQLITSHLWQNAREAIFTGDVETIYSPGGQDQRLVIITNRDPNLKRERERQQLLAEQAGARERAQQGR